MPKQKDWIPKKTTDFYNFAKNFNSTLQLSGAGWSIPSTTLDSVKNEFNTYEPLYLKITNKKTRTSSDVEAHTQERKKFTTLIRSVTKEFIAKNSLITDSQRLALGVTVPDTTPSVRPAITTTPFSSVKSTDGARMKFECRVESDSSRPSRHPDADAVEVAYMVGTAPTRPEDCTKSKQSKRARFSIPLDIADAGKKFYHYERWINSSDDSKNGPWTKLGSATITD